MTSETVTIEVEASTDSARRSFEALNGVAQGFGRQVTSALTSVIERGGDLDDVLRSLGSSLASNALSAGLRTLQDTLSNGLGNLLSAFGGASGGGSGGFLSALGNALPFARGGVVASPSFFPLNGGFGLAGEAGPEAIMPLQRGTDGRLGIAAASSGGGGSITVNITTPDAASFRRSEAQVTSAIARAVQRSRRTL